MAIKKFNTVAGLSVGEDASIDVIDAEGNVTAHTLTTTGLSNLGPISNVIITGGSNGQYLKTDGSGNLSWETIDTSAINNGNSNVNIATSNSNITMSVAGNANIMTVTSTGANVQGYLDVTGNTTVNNLTVSGTLIAGDIAVSSIANGTSNVDIVGVSGNVTMSVNGNANILTVTDTGVNINGTVNVGNTTLTGNTITTDVITVTSANLGSVSNVVITGGSDGYVLTTDGNGNLIWATNDAGAAGANYEVQFNLNGQFSTNANFTFEPDSETLNSNYFAGDGSNLTNLTAINITGIVSNALYANFSNYSTYAGEVDFAQNANTSNYANYANYAGDAINAINANYAGYADTSNTAATVTDSYQPTITTIGTLTDLAVSNNITTNTIIANNQINTNLIIANIGNFTTVNSTNVNVTTQVTTNVLIGNIANVTTVNATNVVATFFTGDGSNLANINGANVSEVSNANYATYSLYTLDANLANLANNAITVTGSSQPNITSVGDLGGLVVLGTSNLANVTANILQSNSVVSNSTLYVAGDATIVGNLIVYGSAIYADVTSLIIQDPIIEQGGLANGVPLPSNDGFDRGQVLHYYSDAVDAPVDAFMGWKNLAGEFAFVSNGSLVDNTVTVHTYGNVHAGVFIGDAYGLSNIPASNINGTVNYANYSEYSGNALVAETVTASSQPNITSVGNLTNANVSGTLITNIANANTINVNEVYANTYYGNFAGNINLGSGNTRVLFNNDGVIGYSTNFTFDKDTNVFTVNGNISSGNANLGNIASASYFSGDGSLLANLNGSNISEVANANYATYAGTTEIALTANTVLDNAQPNITTVGTLVELSIAGNTFANIVNANYFVGDGSNISNVLGSSIIGEVANANYSTTAGFATTAGIVTTASQPNITSVGTLTDLTVTGNITANIINATYVFGDVGNVSNVPSANIVGIVSNANYAAYAGNAETATTATTVTASSQPNITNVGILANLTVDTDVEADTVHANYFFGDGSNLSDINGSNVSEVANANYASYAGNATTASTANTVIDNEQPNITSVGTLISLNVTGNVSADYINASHLYGEAGNISNVQANSIVGTVSTASVANTVNNSAQPNITSLGNLTSLIVSGNASSNNLTVDNTLQAQDVNVIGNLSVSGNVTYINVNSLQVQDPIIQLGGGANGSPLTTNDGKDRGTLLHYYDIAPVSGFMGWDNSNAEFLIASNVLISDDVVAVQQLGNIRAQNFIGNFNGNITGNIVIPGDNTEILYNNDGNIGTSPGFTFQSANSELTVSGNINANFVLANNIIASNITGNLTGSATTAGTVTEGLQPNITAVGTLSALDVTGNITAANASLGNLVIASFLQGTLTSSSQPNITTIGSLSNLTVTGNISGGNANLGNLVVANYFAGDGSLLTDLNGSNITEVANANYASFAGVTFTAETANVANTVIASAQPNITSVGLLTSLSVAGMLTSFDAVLGNSASANFFNGDGGNISNVQSTNIIGTVANANYATYAGITNAANTVNDSAQPNITSVGNLTSLVVIGNITSGNGDFGNVARANFFIGDGGLLSNVPTGEFANYANYAGNAVIAETALVATTVTNAEQSNITSVGVLTELLVSGNIVAGNIDAGNVVVANYLVGDGSFISNIQGSVITGWVASANYSNYAGNAVTAQTALNAITANTATVAVNVTASSQPNITSVGTLVSLDITGNITANIGEFGGNVAAVYFLGDGGYLSNLTGSNVSGIVASANSAEYANIANISTTSTYANIVVDASQPNINSLGVLTSLDVTGLSDLGDVTATNITVGNVTITLANVTADNFFGNFDGNLTSPGYNTSIIFNDSGMINASNSFQFNSTTNTATITGTLEVADSITRDGKDVPTYTSASAIPINPIAGDEWYDELNDRIYKYVYDGATYAWIDISSGFISANVEVSGNTIVLRDANGNIYANHLSGTSLAISGISNLGDVGNVRITGGTANYVLGTDGTGNLAWVDAGSQGVGGTNTQVQYNNNGTFAGSANFTYDYLTETLSANVITALGNLTSTAGNLILSTGELSVNGTSANIFSTTLTNVNLGLSANVTVGSTTGNTTVRGNLVANNISTNGNLVVASLATITNLKVSDLSSNRTPISITNDTIVDSFPVNKYRSAKYTMRVNSDDGYQAVEVLLIHNGVNSYVTIYGSLSTIGTDIISLGTAINSGNVQLLATSTIANTTVNLLGTYVAD